MLSGGKNIPRTGNRYRIRFSDPRPWSLRKQIDGIRDSQRLFEVMGHQEHAQMLLLNPSQKFLRETRSYDRVQRSEGLIHEQQFWLQDQNLGDGDALSLSAR